MTAGFGKGVAVKFIGYAKDGAAIYATNIMPIMVKADAAIVAADKAKG